MTTSKLAAGRIAERIDNLPGPKRKHFRAIHLTNGVGACLITDDAPDPYNRPPRAYVNLSIGVGRLQDPPDCRGLAQLCVQLTMLEASKTIGFVSVRDDVTSCVVELDSSCLEDFLEELRAGIIDPKFDDDSIKSEVQSFSYERCAMDWLQRSSGNPAHPFYRCVQAVDRSIASMAPAELRSRLIEFHKRYYSGNLLRVVVVDSRTLDELETMVSIALGDLPNRLAPEVDISVRELEGVKLKKGGIKIRGKNMKFDRMHFVFPLPDQASSFKSSPDLYVKYLLESEHAGSLKASLALHELYLCDASLMDFGQQGFDFYKISISTDEYKEPELEKEKLVIQLVFRYLAMIRSVGPQQCLHNELRVVLQSKFEPKVPQKYLCPDFAERDQPLALIADDYTIGARLQRFPLRDSLTARHRLTEFSLKAIEDFLNFLTPDRCIVYVSDHDSKSQHICSYTFNGLSFKFCCVPEGQSAEFSEETLHPDLLNICSSPWPNKDIDLDKKIKMPELKPFVPFEICLRPRIAKLQPPGPRMLVIPKAPPHLLPLNARLWFRQDDKFQSDRAFVSIDFALNVDFTPEDQLVLNMLANMFSDSLKNLEKQAKQVGLELSVSRSRNGIQICFAGYIDSLHSLVPAAMPQIRDIKFTSKQVQKAGSRIEEEKNEPILKVDEVEQLAVNLGLAGFLHIKEKLVVTNMTIDALLKMGSCFCDAAKQSLLTPPKASARKKVKETDLQLPDLFANILVFGNATADDAVKIAQSIIAVLPNLTSTSAKFVNSSPEFYHPERLLKKGSFNTVQRGGPNECIAVNAMDNPSDRTCALVFQIPIEKGKSPVSTTSATKVLGEEFSTRASHICLLQMMIAAADDVPRTERFDSVSRSLALGYSANCIVFQNISEKSPTEMEKEIVASIAMLGDHMTSMSQKQLEDYRQKALKSIQELTTPKSIDEHNSMYWTQIMSSNFDFGWDAPTAAECFRAIADGVKKDDLLKYWKKWFQSGSSDRSVLCLQNFAAEAFENPGTSGKVVTNLEKFKSSLVSASVPSSACLKTAHVA